MDPLPAVVLRFANGHLLDAGSEFRSYFDREIEGLRRQLRSDDLRDFKGSNGTLFATESLSAERAHHLRSVKAIVVKILWLHLYSGREVQAWNWLNEVWPTSDEARIRDAVLNAGARGIHAQLDGVSKARADKRPKRAQILDVGRDSEVAPPEAIMLRRPPLVEGPDKDLPQPEVLLDLLVDSAGKVRSAELAGKMKSTDPLLVQAATGWKFIPAFKGGRAVASRIRLSVSPRQ